MRDSKVDEIARGAHKGTGDDPLTTVFTVPNLVTFVRLILIPVFLVLLLSDNPPLFAFIVFALAASTDWVDGQIARRTNSVSVLGQRLDPLVDRFLIGFGIIGVFLVGRVPLWAVVVIIGRDVVLFILAVYIRRRVHDATIPVCIVGKATTATLLVGFASLLLNWPTLAGLGAVPFSFLPGLNTDPCVAGIFLVYAGILLSITAACIYIWRGICLLRNKDKTK